MPVVRLEPAPSSSALKTAASIEAPTVAPPTPVADPGVPLPRSSPPGPLAPTHRRRAAVQKPFVNDEQPGTFADWQDEAGCRKLTGNRHKDFSRCSFSLLANGSAFSVAFVYGCGEHQCSYDEYVWYGAKQTPDVLAGESGLQLEVSPDHRYLIRSELLWSETLPGEPVSGQVTRIERATKKSEKVAECFSAVLSPGNHWYLCRDREGDVLKFPVGGGPTELVVRARVPEGDHVKWGGPFGDYPAPVTFPSPSELSYELYVESELVLQFSAPWRE